MYRAPKNSHRECRRRSNIGRQHPVRRHGKACWNSPGSPDHGMPQADFLGTCEILMSPPNQREGVRVNDSKITGGARLPVVAKNKSSNEWYRTRKETKRSEKGIRKSDCLVVPKKLGHRTEGPSGGKGATGQSDPAGGNSSRLSAARRSPPEPWGVAVGRAATCRMARPTTDEPYALVCARTDLWEPREVTPGATRCGGFRGKQVEEARRGSRRCGRDFGALWCSGRPSGPRTSSRVRVNAFTGARDPDHAHSRRRTQCLRACSANTARAV